MLRYRICEQTLTIPVFLHKATGTPNTKDELIPYRILRKENFSLTPLKRFLP